jgi:uncharacterized membrane protein
MTHRRLRRALVLAASVLTPLALASGGAALDSTFTTIDVPGASFTKAFGINEACGNRALGQIAGTFGDASGTHGFIRQCDDTFTTIDAPGASITQAFGINFSGSIVGSFGDANGTHGFLRTSDGTESRKCEIGHTKNLAASPLDSSKC